MAICEICGKEFDKSKRYKTSTHNLCSNKCKYVFLGNMNRKHAYSHKTPLYAVWKSLRQRCKNPNDQSYKNYGGRGITICDEWNDFSNFYKWAMENGYSDEKLPSGRNKLSIDRIDVNGNYEPSNCRWATDKEQANNTRNNMPYDIKNRKCPICGVIFIAKQRNDITCSKKCGLAHRKILHDEKTKDIYKKTCPICGKVFEERGGHFKDRVCCSRKCANLWLSPIWEFNGEKLRVIEWGEKVGMTAHCLLHRIEIGWSIEEALTVPKGGKRKDYEKYKL